MEWTSDDERMLEESGSNFPTLNPAAPLKIPLNTIMGHKIRHLRPIPFVISLHVLYPEPYLESTLKLSDCREFLPGSYLIKDIF
jgi:hypothetical protein